MCDGNSVMARFLQESEDEDVTDSVCIPPDNDEFDRDLFPLADVDMDVVDGASDNQNHFKRTSAGTCDDRRVCAKMSSVGDLASLEAFPAQLPEDVEARPFCTTAIFQLQCEVNLKKIHTNVRIAEYNPKSGSFVTIRLLKLRVTARVVRTGKVMLMGACDEATIKAAAKQVALLVKKSGHENVKFAKYELCQILVKADLKFPVRIDRLAAADPRHVRYEPELFSSCVLRVPGATFLVTAGGRVTVYGQNTVEKAIELLGRLYGFLHKFQTASSIEFA